MSLQRIQGNFRPSTGAVANYGAPTNVQDPIFAVGTNPGWTSGATLIDGVQLTAPANQRWTLQQLTISALLVLPIFTGGGPIYGRLGKILAGLGTLLSPTPPNPSIVGLNCQAGVQLPADRTAIDKLWDPSSDPLPPGLNLSAETFLPISTTISLPTPLPVDQGEAIGVGIWMLPSLIGQVATANGWGLVVAGATWAITYDDGANPPNYA